MSPVAPGFRKLEHSVGAHNDKFNLMVDECAQYVDKVLVHV